MIKQSLTALALALAAPAFVAPVFAQAHVPLTANAAPAQALVDGMVAKNPDLVDVLMHVTPPGSTQNVVVASHLPQDLGEVSGDDDLGVAKGGKPLVEVQKDGVRIGVLLQMRDAHRHPVGAIGIMLPWHDGDSQAAALARATKLRDGLARQIPSQAALFG